MGSHRRVELRLCARGPFAEAPEVEVAGEISAWDIPLRARVLVDEEGNARGALSLWLGPGVFSYKLRVNGVWTLDAEASRTRSEGGRRNQILAVGASPEPILFAPARPYVSALARGGVRVMAALRRGYGDSLSLHWREPADTSMHVVAMDLVGDEDEHRVFVARIPVSSGRMSLRFCLENGIVVGDESGAELQWQEPSDTTPQWWRQAVIYTVFVDRFRPRALHAKWHLDPGAQRFAGGHLDGITQALPELAEIGVSVLYLTPIHEGANCHRYDMVDPTCVDLRLGGEHALSRLIEAAHARNMRIVVDFSCSHAGDGFPPYEDVKAKGRASRYASWFQWHDDGTRLKHYGSRTDAPLFDPNDPEVRAYFIDLARLWAERGVDGLRLDAAAEVPFDLAREFRKAFCQICPSGVVFGEFVHLHSYRFLDEQAGHAATEFGFFDLVAPFLAEGTLDAAEVARRLPILERERGGSGHLAVRFLCTHDHPRLATLARLRGRLDVIPLGFLMLFTLPGIPMLLYGEEIGLFSMRPEHAIEHVWPDRMPMPWPVDGRSFADDSIASSHRQVVASLAGLRRQMKSLSEGELSFVHGEGSVLVYRREADGETVDIALNAGADETTVLLEDDELQEVELMYGIGDVSLEGQALRLGRFAGALVHRRRLRPQRMLVISGNSVLRDRDFAKSMLTPRSRPTRFDLAITERCNLRCAHCITNAPLRTESRSARQWSRWLLDLLRDDFAFAEHFAFAHGGEPLVSPMLETVLGAIAAARSGLPTMVHVLTNGMLLTAERAERLCSLGVRSISISLDAASPEQNDAIRLGGRLSVLVENIREVIALRRDKGLDLRIGVSAVLLSETLREVDSLVDLCAALGVDWLKLEELVPATQFAEHSLLRLDESELRHVVSAAMKRGRARGLVMVDHTVERPVFRCRMEEDVEGRAFLEADSFANRTTIHPCRASWEIACVEANGDVRLGHFFGPVLGNVADAPLFALWNNDVAVSSRRSAMATRLCQEGPVTCAR